MKRQMVKYTVRADKLDAFTPELKTFVKAIKSKEPGILEYNVYQGPDGFSFVHHVAFDDTDAEMKHSRSSHAKKFRRVLKKCAENPPDYITLNTEGQAQGILPDTNEEERREQMDTSLYHHEPDLQPHEENSITIKSTEQDLHKHFIGGITEDTPQAQPQPTQPVAPQQFRYESHPAVPANPLNPIKKAVQEPAVPVQPVPQQQTQQPPVSPLPVVEPPLQQTQPITTPDFNRTPIKHSNEYAEVIPAAVQDISLTPPKPLHAVDNLRKAGLPVAQVNGEPVNVNPATVLKTVPDPPEIEPPSLYKTHEEIGRQKVTQSSDFESQTETGGIYMSQEQADLIRDAHKKSQESNLLPYK